MLFLLAVPMFLGMAACHRYLALYAPSNVLIRRVRSSPPRWRAVGALVALAGAMILLMRSLELAIVARAPGWLNLVVLVLAWNAIKFGWFALTSAVGATGRTIRRLWRPRGSSVVEGTYP